MSNIIHKVSDKLMGHDQHDDERDTQGNRLSQQQQQQRDDGTMPLPSQHMGGSSETTSGHQMQSKHGGYRQQEHDLQGDTSDFSANRSNPMQGQQMPGPVMGGSDVGNDAWDEDEDVGDDQRRGTRRKDDYADEFQKRYW
ncbi:LAFA_0G21352g1_1 [Lachancea sp. 'fantastica']|nr:LAFA_0G21352g1_1 [Lachancea sp. 'fantastica']